MIEVSRRRRQTQGLDMTPLVDVVFQLLVFFLLTSVFAQRGLPLELPRAEATEIQEKRELVISFDDKKQIRVGDQEVSIEELGEVVRKARVEDPKRAVAVRGDVAAQYGLFVQVVDQCRKVGVEDLMLVANDMESPET